LIYDLYGKTCHNVYWIYSPDAHMSPQLSGAITDVFEDWWHNESYPWSALDVWHSTAVTFQGVISLLAEEPPGRSVFDLAKFFSSRRIGGVPSNAVPNMVAPLVRWHAPGSRTHGRTYHIGFPEASVAFTDRQSVDGSAAYGMEFTYNGLPILLQFLGDHTVGRLQLCLRHRRPIRGSDGQPVYVSPIDYAYMGSRRLCTQRLRMRPL
jgi:hypothetical protein